MRLPALACFLPVLLWSAPSLATDCPPGAPSCKIITLTPQEEDALIRPSGILQSAEQGRYLDLSSTVGYFRDKIAKAPSGVASKTPTTDQQGTPVPQ